MVTGITQHLEKWIVKLSDYTDDLLLSPVESLLPPVLCSGSLSPLKYNCQLLNATDWMNKVLWSVADIVSLLQSSEDVRFWSAVRGP